MKVQVENTGKTTEIHARRISNLIPELKIADRCDRCGARAYVAVLMPTAFHPLLFCAHHFRKHEAALTESAEEILDERWRLEKSVKEQKEDVPTWLKK